LLLRRRIPSWYRSIFYGKITYANLGRKTARSWNDSTYLHGMDYMVLYQKSGKIVKVRKDKGNILKAVKNGGNFTAF
jgi:hypothetical protein